VLFALLGVGTGALYASLAIAVILVYRGSGVVNFAVGAMAMIPAVVYAELRTSGDLVVPVVLVPNRFTLGEPMALLPAAAIALGVGTAVSVLAYTLIFRPLRSAPPVTSLVATVGLTIVLQALAVKSFGDRTVRTPPILPDDVVSVLGRPFPVDRLWIVAVVGVLAIAVSTAYRATRFGLATRAAFLNEKGAVLLGLDPHRLSLANWLIASTLGGVVGILGSSLGGVNPFNYSLYVVPALGAVLAARLHSIPVAVAAAIAIGMFEALAVHLVAQRQVPGFLLGGFSSLVPFVVIVTSLIVRGRTLPDRSVILERAQVPVPMPGRRPWRWLVAVGAAGVLTMWPDPTIRFAALQSVFVATLLMSVVVLTGLVGQVSLAQLAFAGFSAFMLSRFDEALPFPLGPIAAIGVTTVVGTVVSIPALRVRGILFAIVSYSVAVVFDEVLFRSPTFVGRGGMASVEPPRLMGIDLGVVGTGQFPSRVFGVVMLAGATACALLVVAVRCGSLGRRMLAVRTNERAAAAAGINVPRTKVLGAAIASFIAAVAGVMFAYKAADFNGAGLDAQEGLELLALGYLGGIGSVAGAVIGGVLAPSGVGVRLLTGGGSSIDQFLLTGLGLVIVAVRFPAGLAGAAPVVRQWIGRLGGGPALRVEEVMVEGDGAVVIEHWVDRTR
jgi:branched-chain amino acid transport system permease protein